MHKTMFVAGLLLFLAGSGCNSNPGLDEKFNGMYKLDKFESYDSVSGKWHADKWGGKDADGYIQYDGKGHMSVHLYPRDYIDFDTHKKLDSLDRAGLIELARFYQSNFVYFANYRILNDSTIEHHRISATEPKNFGTVLTRHFEFKKDTLILTAVENIENKKMRLRWIKL